MQKSGPGPLRVLAMDHYFDQDLKELERHPGLEVKRFSYLRIRNPALKIFGDDVQHSVEVYPKPELEPVRRRYASWLAGEVRRLYLESPFDVIVLPSDTFYYVRALPEAAHLIGIPVIVVQKETSISDDSMEEYSKIIGSCAPFVSDLMTVCSDRHRSFWLRAGADGTRILVTGQPRFDFYARSKPPTSEGAKTILFLSYFLDAYRPEDLGSAGVLWESLRLSTETELVRVARTGARVIVKPHPQQDVRGYLGHLRNMAGDVWDRQMVLADPGADTRDLIQEAHVVVGFQTTALFEGVVAGRPTIYAAWGESFEAIKDRLIPFHNAPAGSLYQARSQEQLGRLLRAELQPPDASSRAWSEETLGPIDGHSTQRVYVAIREVVDQWPPGRARQALEEARPRFAAVQLVKACLTEAFWMAGDVPAALVGRRLGCRARRKAAAEIRRNSVKVLARRA